MSHFATIYWSGYALLCCLPAIHELIHLGVVKTDGDEVIVSQCLCTPLTNSLLGII